MECLDRGAQETAPNSIVAGDFVEMEGNQGDTQCWGRYVVELPEGSLSAGTSRIRDAKAVDASTVVTSCSFCNWSLNRAAKEMNVDINHLSLKSWCRLWAFKIRRKFY